MKGGKGVPEPPVTPLEWAILVKAWRERDSGLRDAWEVLDQFDEPAEVADALAHLVELGMLRRGWGEGEERYFITDYGRLQLLPDITGYRGGGEPHRSDVEQLLLEFLELGYFTHADRGFGEKKPDIYLLRPKSAREWDLEHPIAVEVEYRPTKHPQRVRENIEKSAPHMPIFFYTRRRRWARAIERIAAEKGLRIVSKEEFFRRWQGPNTVAVYAPEGTQPEVIQKLREYKGKGYHFRIRRGRYLYARKKVGGLTDDVYLGRILDDFKEQAEAAGWVLDESGRLLRPVVLGKTVRWVEL